MARSLLLLGIGASLALLAGCGTKNPAAKTAQAQSGTSVAATRAASTATGIGLEPLQLGPYLAAAMASPQTQQLAVEAGFIDMRQIRSPAANDIFDYRFEEEGAMAATNLFPTAATFGCAVVGAAPTPQPVAAASSLVYSGPETGSIGFAAGLARNHSTTTTSGYDVTKALSGQLEDRSGSTLVKVTAQPLPTTGGVQLAGAFDGSISVDSVVGDMSQSLAKSADDLLISDVATAKNYNLLVVTLYGGAAAKAGYIRCLIQPGTSATLPQSVYSQVLPLRGMTSFFASIGTANSASWSTWTAQIVGQGVEDLTVP